MKINYIIYLLLILCLINNCQLNYRETISDIVKFEDKNHRFLIYLPKDWKYFSSSEILASAIDTSSSDKIKPGFVLSELDFIYPIDSIIKLNIEDLKINYLNFCNYSVRAQNLRLSTLKINLSIGVFRKHDLDEGKVNNII